MLRLEQLAELAQRHAPALSAKVAEFPIGGRDFAFNSRPAVMGVINLSPGSWYRESVCLSVESAVQRGVMLTAQGADLVDIGAESTLANTDRVDGSSQIAQLVPVVRQLCAQGVRVSVETYLPDVARACLEAGAAVINLTGHTDSAEIYRMAAAHDAAVIICYVEGPNVREVDTLDLSVDPIPKMRDYFAREIASAQRAGLHKLLLDPGLGFYYRNLQDSSQRVRYQMQTFLNTFRLRELGWPVCHALPHAFEFFREEVRSAEAFFAVLALLGKTDLLRTHEVSRTRAVLDTLSAC